MPLCRFRRCEMRKWESRNVRISMEEDAWKRLEAALERLPGRSKAEKLGKLLLLGASLLEEEGPKALVRLLE